MNRRIFILIAFLILALAIVPEMLGWLSDHQKVYEIDLSNRLSTPSLAQPFGSDSLGRDHLTRTLLATGLSLKVAGRAFLLAFILAVVLGSVAGLFKDLWPDRILSYLIALIHTVPFILLAVALAAVLQADLETIYLIVGGIAWAPPARIVRAQVGKLRDARYVVAQKAFGFHPLTIFWRSILPAVILPPFITLIYLLPELIGLDVGLSYFGLGAQPPTPTLGRLIFDGLTYLRTAWWISLMPTIVLVGFFLILYAVIRRSLPEKWQGGQA